MWSALLLLAGATLAGSSNVLLPRPAASSAAAPSPPAAPAPPAPPAPPLDLVATLESGPVLRRCGLAPLRGDVRGSCAAEPLLCYAWFDLALRWCDAKLPLAPLQAALAGPPVPVQKPDELCRRLEAALPGSEFQQTHPYVVDLRKSLNNSIACIIKCYDETTRVKPICNYLLLGHDAFVEQTKNLSAAPTEVDRRPSPSSVGRVVQESTVKAKTEETSKPKITETNTNIHVNRVETKSSISDNNVKKPEVHVADKPDIHKINDNPITKVSTPQIIPEKKQEMEFNLDGNDYETEDKDDVQPDDIRKNDSEPEHISNDGSSLPQNAYSAKVDHNGEIEGGSSNTNSESDTYHMRGSFVDTEDSDFFTYLLIGIAVFILGYVVFHNKNRVLGLLIEGRRSNTTRRRGGGAAYRKLDCTLEEAVSSTPPSHGPNIVY